MNDYTPFEIVSQTTFTIEQMEEEFETGDYFCFAKSNISGGWYHAEHSPLVLNIC